MESMETDLLRVLEGLPVGVVAIGAAGRVTLANPAASAMLGLPRASLEGGRFPYEVVAGAPTVVEIDPGDGPTRLVELECASLPRTKGGTAVILVRDVTEFQQAVRDLVVRERQTRRMESVRALLGGIAHSLNNLVSTITGYTECVRENLTEGSQDRDDLDRVMDAGARAGALIYQIRELGREADEGRIALNLGFLVRDAAEMLQASVPSNIMIDSDIAKDNGVVRADPADMQFVVMDVCCSAVQALRDTGGTLEICVTRVQSADIGPGPWVEFRVRASGGGMVEPGARRAEEDAASARLPRAETAPDIVAAHGGSMATECDATHGYAWTVRLPLEPDDRKG